MSRQQQITTTHAIRTKRQFFNRAAVPPPRHGTPRHTPMRRILQHVQPSRTASGRVVRAVEFFTGGFLLRFYLFSSGGDTCMQAVRRFFPRNCPTPRRQPANLSKYEVVSKPALRLCVAKPLCVARRRPIPRLSLLRGRRLCPCWPVSPCPLPPLRTRLGQRRPPAPSP